MSDSAPIRRLDFERLSALQMNDRAQRFLDMIRKRRSVRHFNPEAIPIKVLRLCIEAAGQAPSGANKQPWTFVLVTDPKLKLEIREGAEEEERAFYSERAPQRWLDDLQPFATNWHKPFIEDAPALIVIFAQKYGKEKEEQHYYVNESVGIATGFLLAALHNAGLATLTHTPSPMGFLAQILGRPENERPYLLIPVGYPSADCDVPNITRRSLEDFLIHR